MSNGHSKWLSKVRISVALSNQPNQFELGITRQKGKISRLQYTEQRKCSYNDVNAYRRTSTRSYDNCATVSVSLEQVRTRICLNISSECIFHLTSCEKASHNEILIKVLLNALNEDLQHKVLFGL